MCADDRNTFSLGREGVPLTFALTRTCRRLRGLRAFRNLTRIGQSPVASGKCQVTRIRLLATCNLSLVTSLYRPCRPYGEPAHLRNGCPCPCRVRADGRGGCGPLPRRRVACRTPKQPPWSDRRRRS